MSKGSNAHKDLKRRVQLAVGQLPFARCFLRETGAGVVGAKHKRVYDGAQWVDGWVGGQRIKFGIEGGADLEAFVGPLGRHVEIEIKTGDGRLSTPQRRFRDAVEPFGVIYIEGRSVEDVVAQICAINERDTRILAAYDAAYSPREGNDG